MEVYTMPTLRASDVVTAPEKIQGIIFEKMVSKSGVLIGSITDNKRGYHFNAQSFGNADYSYENAEVGDTVFFIPVVLNRDNNQYKAVKIELVKKKDASLYEFFYPGYSISIREDKEGFYAQTGMNYLQKRVLEKLSRILYVSFGDSHDMGRTGRHIYPFCIMGATAHIKKYIQGKKEFLTVFSWSDNEQWYETTYIVHNEIRNRNKVKGRPLPNFYILISNAKDLIGRINEKKGGSSAAVIPFTVNEILACNDDNSLLQLLLDRFDEYYYANNMLRDGSTIEEDKLLFGDRGKIADSIVQRCIEKKNSGIFGLRRSGKSSVLHAVCRRLESQEIKYIRIEARTLRDNDSWKTSLYNIARDIRKICLDINDSEWDQLTVKEQDELLKLNRTEADYEKAASKYFAEDVQRYTRSEPTFVIALDEIERITYNTTNTAMWRNLDSYEGFWTALRDAGCPLIVCGVNATINEKSSIVFNGNKCDNPMYERIQNCSGFSKTYLPTFTDEQTKEMINTLGGYSNIAFDNVYVDINRAFGGQPYAIRQFCSFAYESVKHWCNTTEPYQLSIPKFRQELEEFNQSVQGEGLIQTILEHITIYRDEYNALKRIALSPEKFQCVGLENKRLIDHLEKYGIIEYDSKNETATFRIDSVRAYLVKNETKDPMDMNNDDRRRHVQDAVAKCETSLKTYILNVLLYNTSIDRNQFRNYIKNFVEPNEAYHGPKTKDNCTLADFFEHDIFKFYFIRIKKVITNKWFVFGPPFEECSINRGRFESYMDDLNAGRTDADHYDARDMTCPDEWQIDNDTMFKFMIAAKEMEKFFKANNVFNV